MNAFPPAVSEVMVCVHYRWIMDFAAVVVSSTTRHSSTNYLPFSSIRTTGILNTAREPEYLCVLPVINSTTLLPPRGGERESN